MRFVEPAFLFQFLPLLLTVYFVVFGVDAFAPRLATWAPRASRLVLIAASALVVWRVPLGGWWLLTAGLTWMFGFALSLPRRGDRDRRAAAFLGIAVNAGMLAYTRSVVPGRTFAFAGASILACHGIAYVVDVYRRRVTGERGLLAWLYLLQFPVLPAGPIVRYPEFGSHHYRPEHVVGLGAFTYGVRRLVIGLVKVALVADTLARPVNAIFALPAARLGVTSAWLAALAFSLELYFRFSGYADIAIGVGRMFGLRYPENFRRPYLADSVREFWRRWHVTAITWLRDYLSLPMAGRDRPTPRLLINIALGFLLLAVMHGASGNIALWALYAGSWLALEAMGFSVVLERWPRGLRHLYLLAVVLVGWVILRADSAPQAWLMLTAMAGHRGANAYPVWRFLDWQVWTALVVAVVGAGPLVPWISRWRVTLDAATAALVMMVSACSLWTWRMITALAFWKPPRRPPASAGN